MKFLDSLYSVTQSRKTEGGFEFDISLFPGHFIYKAHFPGEPITPGVCIIQIATELFSIAMDAPMNLYSAKNVKFLKIVSPSERTDFSFTFSKIVVEGDLFKFACNLSAEIEIYAKLSLICRKK